MAKQAIKAKSWLLALAQGGRDKLIGCHLQAKLPGSIAQTAIQSHSVSMGVPIHHSPNPIFDGGGKEAKVAKVEAGHRLCPAHL